MLPSLISTKEVQTQRLNTCLPCEYIKYIPIVGIAQCSACGCPIASKIRVKNTSCPKGKW